MPDPIVFSGSPLDRADTRRREPAWLAARLAEETTRVLPVWRGNVLVRDEGEPPRLAWATPEVCIEGGEAPVFLGLADGLAHFAADLSSLSDPIADHGWTGVAGFPELRGVASRLAPGDAAIAAQARHVLDWHARHAHCPACGAASRPKDGGWSRTCSSTACAAEHFPRTDPVVIMLVVDGNRCLLGRGAGWPHPFHSALAGFVEPGETLEEAVAREVGEEAGIAVDQVRYLASQPWPFPASLMMGCTARARSTEIRIDRDELEAAAWFTRDQIRAALSAATATLAVPPPMAIAHHLIRWFAEGGVG